MMNNLFLSIASLQSTACYVILFVLFLRFCLRKYPKIYAYALWSVVLFRLLCPFSFESVLSLIPKQTEAPQAIITQTLSPATVPLTNPGTTVPVENTIDLPTVPLMQTVTEPTFDWQSLLPYFWLLGIAVLLIYSLVGLVKLKRHLDQAEPLGGNIYSVSGLETAFVLGIVNSKIYLPEGLSPEEQEYILLHEQTHLRRGDHIIKILAFAALCLHWFNPLVWLAFLLSSQDMEMSCDEAVIAKLGSGVKKAYSSSLLSLAAGKRLLRATPLAFGEGDTKIRIKNVLNYKKPAFWVSILLAAAVLLVGVGLVCDPISEKEAPTASITQEEAVETVRKFYGEDCELEINGVSNMVGDKTADWNFSIYQEMTYGDDTAPHLIAIVAVDGSTGDLWNYQISEDQWVIAWEPIEWSNFDAEILWQYRSDYIGDNSKVAGLAGSLPYPSYFKYEGITLRTAEEPYSLEVQLSTEQEEYKQLFTNDLYDKYSKVLQSLIGNMGKLTFSVKAPTTKLSRSTTFEEETDYFSRTETLEGLEALIKEWIQQDYDNKIYAEELVQQHTDNIKRFVLTLDWPEHLTLKNVQPSNFSETYRNVLHLYFDTTKDMNTWVGIDSEDTWQIDESVFWLNAVTEGDIVLHYDDGSHPNYSEEHPYSYYSEEQYAAKAEEIQVKKALLDSYFSSVWTLNPTSVTFPAYDQSNGHNDDVMGIEPFHVDLQLPEGWSIKSGQPLDGKYYCSLGLWTPLEIYNEKSVKVGSIAYSTYQKYEGAEDLPQAIYSVIAVANHYAYRCQEPTYQVRREHSYGTTAITEVYISAMMSETLGFGGSQVINKGILCYNRDLDVYVAMELDGAVDDRIVQSIADSIGISGAERAENPSEILLLPFHEEDYLGIGALYDEETHKGVDFRIDHGSDVLAVANGTVEEVSKAYTPGTGYGIYVTLDHGNGIQTLYAHCSELLVEEGQYISAGEVIAKSGATGNATGEILHFELMKNGTTLDPMFYIGQIDEPFLFPLPKDSGFTLARPFDEENEGVDFAVAEGTDILAVRNGTVELVQTWRSKGKQIMIYHGQGWYALYSHCGEILVEQGQEVKAGEVIAKVGSTGNTTEPILNFVLGQVRNKKQVDPMLYLE